MGSIKNIAAFALLTIVLASIVHVNVSFAESSHSFSANIGVVSNYIWRGMSQTDDNPAVQGGLDYAHSSGFYAGTWISNVDFGDGGPNYELDFYGGFGGAVNSEFSWDLSTIYYAYPDGQDLDFWEVRGSTRWQWITIGLAYTVYGQNEGGLDYQGDIYYYGLFDYADLPFALEFGARIGYYDFTNDTEIIDGVESESADMWHMGATVSRGFGVWGTLSLNWDQNNGEFNSPGRFDNGSKFWIGWLKEF